MHPADAEDLTNAPLGPISLSLRRTSATDAIRFLTELIEHSDNPWANDFFVDDFFETDQGVPPRGNKNRLDHSLYHEVVAPDTIIISSQHPAQLFTSTRRGGFSITSERFSLGNLGLETRDYSPLELLYAIGQRTGYDLLFDAEVQGLEKRLRIAIPERTSIGRFLLKMTRVKRVKFCGFLQL